MLCWRISEAPIRGTYHICIMYISCTCNEKKYPKLICLQNAYFLITMLWKRSQPLSFQPLLVWTYMLYPIEYKSNCYRLHNKSNIQYQSVKTYSTKVMFLLQVNSQTLRLYLHGWLLRLWKSKWGDKNQEKCFSM